MDEYTPPPIPARPKPPGLGDCKIIRVWLALAIALIPWTAVTIRYWYYLFPESPINPVRHPESFHLFLAALVITWVITFVILPCASKVYYVFMYSIIVASLYVSLTIVVTIILESWQPHMCQTMTDRFPVYVEMEAGNPATGKVYFHHERLWGIEHKTVGEIYHTSTAWKFRTWDPSLKTSTDNYKSTDWPLETAVDEIWTSVKRAQGADGTINGTCLGIPCLTGKLWMSPNLEFEWTYRNPQTGKKTTKRIGSDEGSWYFGREHRPLASLKSNGIEVFRAQSTSTVCSGGDGDIETSLVPLGLMFIAENIYKNMAS